MKWGWEEDFSPYIYNLIKEEKIAKTKKFAALPLDERRKRLEMAAEHAAFNYETDQELTLFTALDGLAHDRPQRVES